MGGRSESSGIGRGGLRLLRLVLSLSRGLTSSAVSVVNESLSAVSSTEELGVGEKPPRLGEAGLGGICVLVACASDTCRGGEVEEDVVVDRTETAGGRERDERARGGGGRGGGRGGGTRRRDLDALLRCEQGAPRNRARGSSSNNNNNNNRSHIQMHGEPSQSRRPATASGKRARARTIDGLGNRVFCISQNGRAVEARSSIVVVMVCFSRSFWRHQ